MYFLFIYLVVLLFIFLRWQRDVTNAKK